MSKKALLVAVAILAIAILATVAAACGSSTPPSTTTPAASSTGFNVATVKADSAINAMLPSAIKSAGVMRVASDVPYPPWENWAATGSTQVTGFDYDLAQAIAARMGIKALFVPTTFDNAILAVKGAKDDVIMSDMYDIASRRAEGVSFVDYAADATAILVLKGNPKGITTPDSLSGMTVTCESGTTQQAYLQDLNKTLAASGKPQMQILVLPSQPAASLALKSGRAVAELTDHSVAVNIAKTYGGGNAFEVVVDPASPAGYNPQLVGAAIMSTNTQFISAFQKSLQSLIDDGTYTQVLDKYSGYSIIPVKSAQLNQGGMSANPSASTTP